jgi:hypothetical protein
MANQKTRAALTAEQQTEHRVIREKVSETLSRENKGPSLNDLIASGDIDPDSVTTVGDHEDFQELIMTLKEERKRKKLSLKDVAARMGSKVDAPALSRLENGENDNPTINTVARYARALGKRIKWECEDVPNGPQASR